MTPTYSQRQQAALEAVKQAVATLADVGHDIAGDHLRALDWCRAELEAIEEAVREALPNCEYETARMLVAALVTDYTAMCDVLANDLDKETIALLEESLPDIAHRSPARGKRMRAHLGKLQARIRKAQP